MKKSLIFIFLMLLIATNISARKGEHGTINLSHIPSSLNDFLKLRDKMAKTPQGGATLFIVAMIIYEKNKDFGMKCFTITLAKGNLSKSKNGVYKGYMPDGSFMYFIKQLDQRLYLGKVYIQNTSYKNGYKLPSNPYTIEYVQFTTKDSQAKLFVETTSGNRARPISMRKNNRGIWKVWGASSLFVGVGRRPMEKVDDDL